MQSVFGLLVVTSFWSGVHFLVVFLPTVLLNCETWRLCNCVTPNVATFAQPTWTTFTAFAHFRVVVSSRDDAITSVTLCGADTLIPLLEASHCLKKKNAR